MRAPIELAESRSAWAATIDAFEVAAVQSRDSTTVVFTKGGAEIMTDASRASILTRTKEAVIAWHQEESRRAEAKANAAESTTRHLASIANELCNIRHKMNELLDKSEPDESEGV